MFHKSTHPKPNFFHFSRFMSKFNVHIFSSSSDVSISDTSSADFFVGSAGVSVDLSFDIWTRNGSSCTGHHPHHVYDGGGGNAHHVWQSLPCSTLTKA